MSETNGNPPKKPEWLERLERVEASHVKLMTDHEVFVAAQERAWERHEKFVAEQEAWAREENRRWEAQREENKDLDRRIAALVSGIGELVRESRARTTAPPPAKP